MAYRDDIRERTKKLNPRILELSDKIDSILRESGGCSGVIVTTTEDMTSGEEEMAIFAGLIKEGCSPEEAEVKAKEKLKLLRKIFNY